LRENSGFSNMPYMKIFTSIPGSASALFAWVALIAFSSLAAGQAADAPPGVQGPDETVPSVERGSGRPDGPETGAGDHESPVQTDHFDLKQALRGEGESMSSERAARMAVAHSPAVKGARAALRKAQEGAARALLAVYPRLDLSARYTRLSDVERGGFGSPEQAQMLDDSQVLVDAHSQVSPEGGLFDQVVLDYMRGMANMKFPLFLDQYALRAEVKYPLSDLFFSILPGYRAARGFAEAQARSIEAERQKVALSAREAFYNFARARAALVVAMAGLAQSEAHRRDVAVSVSAGVLARVELMRMDAQIAAARVAVERARGGVAIARTGLGVLLGRPVPEQIAIEEDLDAPLPELRDRPDDLLEQAAKQRPEMRALAELIDANNESISARRGGRLPHLSLAAGVDYANPNQRIFPQEDKFAATWDISAVLSWSPNDLLDANRGVAEANADLEKAQADMDGLRDALQIEVIQACEEYSSARAAMEAARAGIEAAEESFRIRREQFRAGSAVATEVIDAEAELRRARLELVNASIDVRIARARLDRAVGRKPPGSDG
jgi:outer membrane protein